MDNFQIIDKLGEGAYSTVYKVKRILDNNIYALKKVKLINLSEKEKLNALNEVRLLASINSNYVISYKEAFFDEKDSTLSIVMEFADGGDLYQKIVEHKKSAKFFEENEIWKIFIQMVRGLKALHDLKILHRDLKSANIFLLKNGYAKLGDLNVSKVARRGLGYTQTGTPYYASPEVWKDQPYDNKSDIWSLGCVLYEMITLRPPFRAQNMEGLFNKVIKGQFNKIPDRFSDDLFEIVKLLIQVNSDLRPSCDQILKNSIMIKKIEYFNSFEDDKDSEDKELLKTIRIPKNLLFLSDKLPKPKYQKQLNKSDTVKSDNSCDNKVVIKNYRSYNKKNVNGINRELLPKIMQKQKSQIELNNKFIEKNIIPNKVDLLQSSNINNVNNINNINNRNLVAKKYNSNNNLNNQKNNIYIINNSIDRKRYLQKSGSSNLPGLNIISKNKKINININKNLIYGNKNNNNLNQLNEIYKICAPYLNKPLMPSYQKFKIENHKYDYIKNIGKYYKIEHENVNNGVISYLNNGKIYRSRINSGNKIVPTNRKLSPIKRNMINIY